MKKKLRNDRNIQIFLGLILTWRCLSRFSMEGIEGLSAITFFSGIVGILAFLSSFFLARLQILEELYFQEKSYNYFEISLFVNILKLNCH